MQNVGTNVIWLSDSQDKAKAQQGLKLNPMGSLTLRYLASEKPESTWYAWAENADTNLAIFEVEGSIPGSGGPAVGTLPGGSQNAAALVIAFGTGAMLR